MGGEPQTSGAPDADPQHCRVYPQEASGHIGDGSHRIPDRIQRDFNPEALDVAWCGDISYINTWEGFLYLSFVEDLASRRILGLSMASHMRATLVGDALSEAVGIRGSDVAGVVFHSDRGTQYTSEEFAELCHRHGVFSGAGPHSSVLGQRSRRIVPRHVGGPLPSPHQKNHGRITILSGQRGNSRFGPWRPMWFW